MGDPKEQGESGGSVKRAVLIGLGVFALAVIALALAVWFGGESTVLPFEYDGF